MNLGTCKVKASGTCVHTRTRSSAHMCTHTALQAQLSSSERLSAATGSESDLSGGLKGLPGPHLLRSHGTRLGGQDQGVSGVQSPRGFGADGVQW